MAVSAHFTDIVAVVHWGRVLGGGMKDTQLVQCIPPPTHTLAQQWPLPEIPVTRKADWLPTKGQQYLPAAGPKLRKRCVGTNQWGVLRSAAYAIWHKLRLIEQKKSGVPLSGLPPPPPRLLFFR